MSKECFWSGILNRGINTYNKLCTTRDPRKPILYGRKGRKPTLMMILFVSFFFSMKTFCDGNARENIIKENLKLNKEIFFSLESHESLKPWALSDDEARERREEDERLCLWCPQLAFLTCWRISARFPASTARLFYFRHSLSVIQSWYDVALFKSNFCDCCGFVWARTLLADFLERKTLWW